MSSLEFLREHFFSGVPRYRHLGTLGRGGMGVVYKAQDLDLDEVIAIKVLFAPAEFDEEALLARFKREVSLNRKIKHPNVARLHDFGMSHRLPYVSMEYVEGKDLATVLEEDGPLPPARAVAILRQVARGSAAAHDVGIVHRDIKPQNIMVTPTGAVAILDFGLARGKALPGITLLGTTVGTPHYMSPEQARGKATDARSDIYSIGVVAFEILTGRALFDAPSPMAIALKHVEEPVPLDVLPDHGVPAALAEVILRCLAKSPGDRFASATELDSELALLGPLDEPAAPSGGWFPRDSRELEGAADVRELLEAAAEGAMGRGMPADLQFTFEEEASAPHPEPAAPSAPKAPVPSPASKTPSGPPAPARTATPRPLETRRPASPGQVPPLPRTPSGAAPLPKPRSLPRSSAEPKLRKPIVLVVDDDPAVRRLIQTILEGNGCATEEAVTGQRALEILHERPADVVIMDVQLPLLDGFDAARILKSQPRFAELPIIFLSGHFDRNRLAFALSAGGTDFLEKPVGAATLVEKVWRILKHLGFSRSGAP